MTAPCLKNKKQNASPCGGGEKRTDWIALITGLSIIGVISTYLFYFIFPYNMPAQLHHFTHTVIDILGDMWWGVGLGIIIVGIMSKLPREAFSAAMGQSNSFGGLLRAVFAGLFLDLCCHGILLVAAKLYERGVSLAQVITFLVASPWNSISLTLILIGLIGFKWTLLYIAGSVVIALISGVIIQKLVTKESLPDNPNTPDAENQISFKEAMRPFIQSIHFSLPGSIGILKSGWRDGKMIIKWLLFGTLIAASLRTFVPADLFAEWLGPTVLGLFITLLMATIIEICSEGSAPVAGEIVTNANAPGNGFTFLMAGVATDYTEIMAIKEFTGRWKIALALPLITVPQVLFIGFLMNMAV